MTRPTKAFINQSALLNNLKQVSRFAPDQRIIAIIKANAYGHGMASVARILAPQVDAFGVACLEEAIGLRNAGILTPSLLLEGVLSLEEYPIAAHLGLSVVIHHPWQIAALETVALSTPLAVWLKVDTGMHRLGLAPESIRHAWMRLQACSNVALPIRLMTHFACADTRESLITDQQFQCFRDAVSDIPGEWCLANSAAILGSPKTHGHWVRPGLMLYGVSPFPNESAAGLGLQPVMQFESQIIATRLVPQGQTVGYGGAWRCPIDTRIGTIAVGYADGYPRHASSGTPILIKGRPAPLVGRVSMDMLCVDLQNHPDVLIGDSVILWGDGLPIENIAVAAGTIPYELLCHLGARVPIEF